MRVWRLVSGLVAACLLAEPTVAQVAEPGGAAAQPVPGLEEIIVTAEKRPENIQKVPLSIVAFSAESLRQLEMTEGFDLATQVPNMNIDAPLNLYDMERVEVLLGPQGTLWGKNTTGGAINFISAHLLLRTDWNYRGDYYVNADNLHNPYIPGRTIGNLRAAYIPRNDRWELAVWVRNVRDQRQHLLLSAFALRPHRRAHYDGEFRVSAESVTR